MAIRLPVAPIGRNAGKWTASGTGKWWDCMTTGEITGEMRVRVQ